MSVVDDSEDGKHTIVHRFDAGEGDQLAKLWCHFQTGLKEQKKLGQAEEKNITMQSRGRN